MASIGQVDQVEGKGIIDRNDNDIFIEQELEVEQFDTVKTGNGKVGILFVDDTRVDVTQHSKLIIDEFVYDPNTKKGKLNLSAKLGTIKYASGQIAKTSRQDIVITTALIPGKPAPKLISDSMVKSMKPGSVIVDLAAVAGGNCSATEADKINIKYDVNVVGYTNIPSRLAGDASRLFARNIFSFIENIWDAEKSKVNIDLEDEIVKGTLLTKAGKLLLK